MKIDAEEGNGEGERRVKARDVHSKRLVQVQVADITTTSSRISQSNLSIQVGAIQIDLSTIVVNYLTSILDAFFKDTKGRWIGNL